MKIKKIFKPLFAILALVISSSLVLTSCSLRLPEHLRYKKINEVVEQVDYKSIGKISIERYDRGDGVFSPSFFFVKIEGGLPEYELLEAEILKVKNIDCYNVHEGYADCKIGVVDVEARLINEDDKTHIMFVVTDIFGGRDPQ